MRQLSNSQRLRDTWVGAALTLAAMVVTAQWMGRAAIMLALALAVSLAAWAMTRWQRGRATLMLHLLTLGALCLHGVEEYAAGFPRRFPTLIGATWSNQQFVLFNLLWVAVFAAAAIGVARDVRVAYVAVFFLAIGGGIGNGIGHLLLCALVGGYFPGAATAPLMLLLGIALLRSLYRARTDA